MMLVERTGVLLKARYKIELLNTHDFFAEQSKDDDEVGFNANQ